MGVLKSPKTPKPNMAKTPSKGKTPAKNVSPKSATPGGQKNVLKTAPTSAKKQNLNASSKKTTNGNSELNFVKSPNKGKTPAKNVSPKSATPAAKQNILKTPKSVKKQNNLNASVKKTTNGSSELNNVKTPNKGKTPAKNVSPKSATPLAQQNILTTPKSGKKQNNLNASVKKTPVKNVTPQASQSNKKKRSLSNSEDSSELKQFAGTKSLKNIKTGSKTPPKKQKVSKENKKNVVPQRTRQPSANKRIKHHIRSKIRKLLQKVKSNETKKDGEKMSKKEIAKTLEMKNALVLKLEKMQPVQKKGKKNVNAKQKVKAKNNKNTAVAANKGGVKNVKVEKKTGKAAQPIKANKKNKAKKVAVIIKQEDIEEDESEEEKVEEDSDVAEEEDSDAAEEEDSDVAEEEDSDVAEEEDSDDEENSDYEVEKTVKAEKVSKSLEYDPELADAEISHNEPIKVKKNIKKEIKQKPDKQVVKLPPIDPKTLKKEDVIEKGKSRYVVFVGNLPFTADQNEIRQHFSSVGEIESVRIPKSPENKPRGFAYVELKNPQSFEKALSLHQTSLGGRRLNVSYTMSGKKNSDKKMSIIKSKNLKLHAMRKSGMLAGSKKETTTRSARRNKAKKGKEGTENSA